MLALILAVAMTSGSCELKVGVNAKGTVFTDRFTGWYKTTLNTMDRVLRGGCYNDASPQPTSAVTLFISKNAPDQIVQSVWKVLNNAGWSRDRVKLQPWTDEPYKPR